jgi:hypothetical protein
MVEREHIYHNAALRFLCRSSSGDQEKDERRKRDFMQPKTGSSFELPASAFILCYDYWNTTVISTRLFF